MKTSSIQKADWQGVFSVPPLARHRDAARSINWEASAKIAAHIHKGGVTRLLYGGNAFLYHITLAEFEALLDWLSSFDDALWAIPVVVATAAGGKGVYAVAADAKEPLVVSAVRPGYRMKLMAIGRPDAAGP